MQLILSQADADAIHYRSAHEASDNHAPLRTPLHACRNPQGEMVPLMFFIALINKGQSDKLSRAVLI